jgi:hypothetical protein
VEPGDWNRPARANDSAGRYGSADDSAYQGFHTYATSDLYDTNGGNAHWPDNWSGSGPPPVPEDGYDPEEPEPKRDYWAALVWTCIWYAVPVFFLLARALFQPGAPDPLCVELGLTNCASPRGEALSEMVSNSPLWLAALVASLALTLVLRWASDSWRAATIGFCAAVVSGGAITVLYNIW